MMRVWQWVSQQALGLFFVVVGAGGFALALRIPTGGFTNPFDPGPRALPMILTLLLMLGGVVELFAGNRRAEKETEKPARALLIMVALIAYVLALPYAGFGLATLVLASLMAWRLGSAWWVAILLAMVLVAVVHLLFGHLFRVPLPAGVLGLPI